MEPIRIRVEEIAVRANVPAGMNPLVVMSLAYMLRSTADDPPPIHVVREGGFYRIMDGRHRFIGAVIAGRSDVLAVVHDPPSHMDGPIATMIIP